MVMEKGHIIFGVVMSVMATSRLVETSPRFGSCNNDVATEHEKNKTISMVVNRGGGLIEANIEQNITVAGNEIDISLINGTRIVFNRKKKEWVVRIKENEHKCTCYLAQLPSTTQRFKYFEAITANGSNSKIMYNSNFKVSKSFHTDKDNSYLIQNFNPSGRERVYKMCAYTNLYWMYERDTGIDRKSDICSRTCWVVCDDQTCYDECLYVCP